METEEEIKMLKEQLKATDSILREMQKVKMKSEKDFEASKLKAKMAKNADWGKKNPGAQNAPWLWGDEKDQKYGKSIGEIRVADDGTMTFLSEDGKAVKIRKEKDLEKVKTMALLKG